MTADCHMTNTGGTLVFQPLTWDERQRSRPAVRSVPRAATQHLDPDTYLIEVKNINFTARLTDAEKTSLMNIFYANAKVTLQLYNSKQAGYWTYTGWLQKPQMNYEYKVENGANIRWWRCSLEVLVDIVSGPNSSGVQEINDGSFEDGDGWKDGYNDNPVSGSTDEARTGTHSLFLYSNYVIQVTPISVVKATIGSFGFWFIAPVTNTDTSYIIYFTDATDSGVIAIPAGDYFGWTYFDITSQVPSGKSVAYIGFYGDSTNPTYVDDVSLITNSQSGLSDTTGVLLGAGALDPTGIYLGFVTDFERLHEKNVQVSNWLNQAPTTQISYSFWDNKLVKLNYTFRASDEDKYYLDQMILLAELVSLDDNTNNIDNTSDVWIQEISARYTSDNWDRPWIVSISLLTEEITEHTNCPIGEMIYNGDFSIWGGSGYDDGWSSQNAFTTNQYSIGLMPINGSDSYIEQTLNTSIPVACVETFSFSVFDQRCFSRGGYVVITYTDSSTTNYDYDTSGMITDTIDLTGILDAGKTIQSIKIAIYMGYTYGDGLTYINNVTLISG